MDLLRKFFLTALPRLIGTQGSASQRIVVLAVSICFLALQIHWTPYKHARSNVLKTAVDFNIFLFIAVAQWLRAEQLSGYGDIRTQSTVTGMLAVFTSAVFIGGIVDSCVQARQTRAEQNRTVRDIMTAAATEPFEMSEQARALGFQALSTVEQLGLFASPGGIVPET